ncbi:hypothetical protein ACE1SV_28680 [Streptomyces sp. E-15]
MESVDSRGEIHDAHDRLYGKTVFRPDLDGALPAHGGSGKKRSVSGSGGRSRRRTGAAYFTSTKSPAALTAGVVVVPAKE